MTGPFRTPKQQFLIIARSTSFYGTWTVFHVFHPVGFGKLVGRRLTARCHHFNPRSAFEAFSPLDSRPVVESCRRTAWIPLAGGKV